MTEPANDRCPFCEKQGLPILPLRPAVARTDCEDVGPPAFDLSATLGDRLADIALPAESAKYTARLLRPGYLYVFNEVRGEWKAYLVTGLGYLYEFDIEDTTPPDADRIEFSCFRTGEEYVARCLTIPDARNAGAVWLGFSDVAWTAAVLDRHRKQAYRERHMTRVDVGQWVAGDTEQCNTAPFDQLTRVVNEFAAHAPDDPSGGQVIGEARVIGRHSGELKETQALLGAVRGTAGAVAFSHSHHSFVFCGQEAGGLVAWAAEAGQQAGASPMLAMVGDPVGVTAELAMLMATRMQETLAAPEHERPLAVSVAINNIRRFIEDDAENRQFWKSERAARNALDPAYMGLGDGGGAARAGMALAESLNPRLRQQREEYFEQWRNPSLEQVRDARANAWDKYRKKYDHRRLASWEDQWTTRVAELDRTVIKPLAEAHVDWMQSEALAERLHCSCDERDIQSGKGFVDSVLFCIQNTQEYAPCSQLYSRWLRDTKAGKANLVLRAMGYNQAQVLGPIDAVATGGLQANSLKGLPWGNLITAYENAIVSLGEGGRNSVARLVAALGGPVAEVAGRAVDEVIGPALVFLGVIAKAPVIMVDLTMSKADAIAELTARAVALNPKVAEMGVRDVNRAIDLQMRKAKIRGAEVNARGHYRYLVMLDPQVVGDFPGLTEHGTPRRFAENALLTADDHGELTRLRWKKLLPGAVGLGIVAACLQIVALIKLADEVERSMEHETNEKQWRFHASIAGLAGTLAETTGKWSEKAAAAGSRLAMQLEKTLGVFLRSAGKALGIGAGLVSAAWDGVRGWREIREGNGVGWLYIGSAVGSLAAAVMFTGWAATLFGAGLATGIGIVLIVLVLLVAVLIEVFKDNKLQDWLERCYFGRLSDSAHYRSHELELKELEIALEG